MTTDTEFHSWPKIHRLTGNSAQMVVTEKIDGTNGQILFLDSGVMRVGSRKRWITPEDDNFGFAQWAYENQSELFMVLGPGRHYGEWYGQGIQRNYGLQERRFALFNVHRWGTGTVPPNDFGLEVVPTLYRGPWDDRMDALHHVLADLRANGSMLVPEWSAAEGVIVQHLPSRHTFKVLLENNDVSKSEAKRLQEMSAA